MFWSLFTFRGNSTQEPASVVCNNEHGDLFCSGSPQRNRCQPQPTQEKIGRGLEKMQVNGPEVYKLARKKSMAVGVACMAIHKPAPGLKRENL